MTKKPDEIGMNSSVCVFFLPPPSPVHAELLKMKTRTRKMLFRLYPLLSLDLSGHVKDSNLASFKHLLLLIKKQRQAWDGASQQ